MPDLDDGMVAGALSSLGAPSADGEVIVATGPGALAYESGATVRASLGLGTTATPTFTRLNLFSAADPKLTLKETGSTGFEVYDATPAYAVIRKLHDSGPGFIQISPVIQDGTSDCGIHLFPYAATTGKCELWIYDGAGVVEHKVRSNGGNSALHIAKGSMAVGHQSWREKLDVNGGVAAKYGVFDEQSSAPTVAAGEGAVWVKDAAPSAAVFTDDAGTDYHMGGATPEVTDPGDGNAISVSTSARIYIDSGSTGETNTLDDPTEEGHWLYIGMDTHGGGDRVITADSFVDFDGTNTITLDGNGRGLWLRSQETRSNGSTTIYWQVWKNLGATLSTV